MIYSAWGIPIPQAPITAPVKVEEIIKPSPVK